MWLTSKGMLLNNHVIRKEKGIVVQDGIELPFISTDCLTYELIRLTVHR